MGAAGLSLLFSVLLQRVQPFYYGNTEDRRDGHTSFFFSYIAILPLVSPMYVLGLLGLTPFGKPPADLGSYLFS